MIPTPPARPPHYHLRMGIGYILLCWLCLTLSAPFIRQVNQHVPMTSILCIQGAGGLLVAIPWMVAHGKESLFTKNWGLILFRTACGLTAYSSIFLLIRHTSIVDAYLFNNTTPLFIPFVIWIWLRKPIENKLWPGLIGGFIGIMFILKPGAEILNPAALAGIWLGVSGALVMVSLRLLSRTTRNHTVLFYFFLFSALATFPFMFFSPFPSGIEWLELIAIALLSTGGQFAMIRALHHADPSTLGPFNYCSVVFAGLLDWFLYGVKPDLLSWIGIVLICMGGIWAIRAGLAIPLDKTR